MEASDVVHELSLARWDIMRRIRGSSHATLIGLMVEWWVSLSSRHTVLEGPPACGKGNAGWADAMFCCSGKPFGILEVEGGAPPKVGRKLDTFRRYLAKFTSLRFAIMLLYQYGPSSRAAESRYHTSTRPACLQRVREFTARYPKRPVIAVTVDKTFSPSVGRVLRQSGYYSGETSAIAGILFEKGIAQKPVPYLGSPAVCAY